MDDLVRTAETMEHWLLLIHQLPAKPAYLRVKVWRRLQAIGAVAVKNAVYALPANEQTQEDFAWLHKEIVDGGGEALICEARLVDGLSDAEVRALFTAARDGDYEELANDARALAGELPGAATSERRAETKGQLSRLKTRMAQIVEIDFFGANGREAADGLLAGLEAKLKEEAVMGTGVKSETATTGQQGTFTARTWVTRQGVQVDRIACAWLIRRFIDPEASFRFVPGKDYEPVPGELRFDMFEAEFTHEGDQCSFEVLLRRTEINDPALQAIAEIIHDIDLKDGKFGREEASGIKTLIAGITKTHESDEQRVTAGGAILDSLYASFSKKHK